VLINGGSGGVGLHSIQIARHIVGDTGTVVATCSSKNFQLVKENGANDAIDYTSVNLTKYLAESYADKPFDLIVDAVGSFDLFKECSPFLNPMGCYVMVGGPIPSGLREFISTAWNLFAAMFLPRILGGVPRRFQMMLTNPTKENVSAVGKLVDEKAVKTILDSEWPFDNHGIEEAYTRIMSHRARGKIVVKVV